MFYKPEFRVSYQGKASYVVGICVQGKGEPKIEVCGYLHHTDLIYLNDPESFWTTGVAQVGAVSWESTSVPFEGCRHKFPDESLVSEFPGRTAGRWSQDYKTFEVETPPVLVANSLGFDTKESVERDIANGYTKRSPSLWEGKASEMDKDLWFATIFPHLSPYFQVAIVKNMDRTNVGTPDGLTIPDQPYVYSLGDNAWDIRWYQLRKEVQYFNKSGWTSKEFHAKKFHSKEEANLSLDAALQAIASGNDEEKG